MTDHDRLFKELLTTFFVEFIELFLPSVAAYLNPDSLVSLDKEVFTDVTAGKKYETDILMQAQFKDQDSYFLIHLENQSSSEADFNKRMFRYFARLLEKHDKPVYPIVLFSYNEPLRLEASSYRIALSDKIVLDFNYEVIQLNQLNWYDFVQRPNPVASALMTKMKVAPEDRVRVKLECLRMLVGLGLDPARMQLISGFVDTYLTLNEVEQQSFQADLNQISPSQERQAIMQIVTSWMKDGIRQGKHEILLKLLTIRVGQLEPELETHLQNLSEAELDHLTEAIFSFTTVSDLTNWLKQNQS